MAPHIGSFKLLSTSQFKRYYHPISRILSKEFVVDIASQLNLAYHLDYHFVKNSKKRLTYFIKILICCHGFYLQKMFGNNNIIEGVNKVSANKSTWFPHLDNTLNHYFLILISVKINIHLHFHSFNCHDSKVSYYLL